MIGTPVLGKLVTLPARDVWANEAQVFTPWLAANLDLLSEALGIDQLELRATEYVMGDFRLDILAEDSEGKAVLIENQFGVTDHGHLGQLLSYVASENRPSSVIWVAERFRESHRAAIDWMNANTSTDYNFFGVEIEALKIGDSAPAPFFNVVAKPNNWARTVRAGSPNANSSDPERYNVRRQFWVAFSEYLRTHDSSFVIRRESKDHWFDFSTGRGGVSITATISTQKQRIQIELYLARDPQKIGIRQLATSRVEIEREFGEILDWQELPSKRASRIAITLSPVDPSNPDQYARQHAWMLDMMRRFRRVFGERIRELDFTSNDDIEEILG